MLAGCRGEGDGSHRCGDWGDRRRATGNSVHWCARIDDRSPIIHPSFVLHREGGGRAMAASHGAPAMAVPHAPPERPSACSTPANHATGAPASVTAAPASVTAARSSIRASFSTGRVEDGAMAAPHGPPAMPVPHAPPRRPPRLLYASLPCKAEPFRPKELRQHRVPCGFL